MTFATWIDTFINEKGLDTDQIFEVEGPSGPNFIPLECVISAIKQTVGAEQSSIKTTIVKIDFMNGEVLEEMAHIAKAIAI